MEISAELKNAIESRSSSYKTKELIKISETMTKRYRDESGKGESLVRTEAEALVYSIVRMPATFGAVSKALEYTMECVDCKIDSLLDVGAGTGAVSWACNEICSPESIVCLERESVMMNFGKSLMTESQTALANAKWIKKDISAGEFPYKADLVAASYVLSELSEEQRKKTLLKLWDCADKLLLIIEPGTPEAFRQLKASRELLLSKGAEIVAPCPHNGQCRLAEDDWCHFTARISRSRLHKLIKSGDVPYEDEKFSFMAFSKIPCTKVGARVLRHPMIEKGNITLQVCAKDENKTLKIRKRDGSAFKIARKAQCGDLLDI
ncbi:MAG: small ribosomal subunit Rsm22 family protein [Hominimerdicola sp.]